jgi:hypothetical protein
VDLEVLQRERDVYLRDRIARKKSVERKRKEVFERAQQLKELQQEYYLSQQIAKEEQHRAQFRGRMLEKQQSAEAQRMRQEKQRENVERARRQHVFQEEILRSKLAEDIVYRDPTHLPVEQGRALTKEVQRYRIQAAKMQYLTPQQRGSMPRPKSVPARSRISTGTSIKA